MPRGSRNKKSKARAAARGLKSKPSKRKEQAERDGKKAQSMVGDHY